MGMEKCDNVAEEGTKVEPRWSRGGGNLCADGE